MGGLIGELENQAKKRIMVCICYILHRPRHDTRHTYRVHITHVCPQSGGIRTSNPGAKPSSHTRSRTDKSRTSPCSVQFALPREPRLI